MAPRAGFEPARGEPTASSGMNWKRAEVANFALRRVGSSGWIRTSNPPVNSRMLCR